MAVRGAGDAPVLGVSEAAVAAAERLGIIVEGVEAREVRYSPRPQRVGRAVVEVHFNPTIFSFAGWRVLHPTPTRLVLSSARSVGEALSLDLRRDAREALPHVELLWARTVVEEYSIGGGRLVKAFRGRAVYGVSDPEALSVLVALLAAAERLGVGKSRGIGFGRLRLESVKPAEEGAAGGPGPGA